MIKRVPSIYPTRSRSVVHNGMVTTVAVAEQKHPDLYEQARDVLRVVERNLLEAGTSKERILTTMIYITDIAKKDAFNRAWDEWVDLQNPPLRACFGVDLEAGDLVELVITAEA